MQFPKKVDYNDRVDWRDVAWQDRGRDGRKGTKKVKKMRNIYPLDLIFWHRRETCVKIKRTNGGAKNGLEGEFVHSRGWSCFYT